MKKQFKKIVLAYSGGLDTSIILKWLKDEFSAKIIACIGNVGQDEDTAAASRKATKTGAEKVHLLDLREEFVKDFVFPAVQANAVYEGTYLMGTSLARPVLAKHLVRIAQAEGADAIAHGCTSKGNDQVRFELAIAALDPSLGIIAPWRDWGFTGRDDLFEYAEKHGIELPVSREKPYSMDANVMHISYEGGILEDPWAEPPENMFRMTVAPEKAPDKAEYVEIAFQDGLPISVNGEALPPVKLVTTLNGIAGKHGIGRVDIVENRFIGMKSRGVYETPGTTLLHIAHRGVESITMDREIMHLRDSLVPKFSELVYYGFWFSPETQSMLQFIKSTQKGVTGTARMKLYKGTALLMGRKSPRPGYDPEVASFENFANFSSNDAGGFIRMNALRLILNPNLKWQS